MFKLYSRTFIFTMCDLNVNFRILQASCDIAFEYAHMRKQFNQYLAQFQLVQVK